MTRRLLLAIVVALIAAGCGSAASSGTATRTSPPPNPVVLAQFTHGVGAIETGTNRVIWQDEAAVSAPDGSAVFGVHGTTLVRFDGASSRVDASWPLARPGFDVDAVAPGGHWVALTEHGAGAAYKPGAPRASTRLVVFDTQAGHPSRQLTFAADLNPEAFSVDGSFVFALDNRGDHYRVQTIDLRTGARSDTLARDKTLPPEDMHGSSVRGVLSADGTLLATLYRNPVDYDEPAFVHVLNLRSGWTYCADLPRPFGTGPVGSDVIELAPHDTVLVGSTAVARVASIDIGAVREAAATPVPVALRTGTVISGDTPFRRVAGFVHRIATVPA